RFSRDWSSDVCSSDLAVDTRRLPASARWPPLTITRGTRRRRAPESFMRSSSRALLSSNALTTAMLAVGFVNNIAIAALFGLTRRVDAFYAALMLPNLFMVLCLDYLGKNFMPAFARAKKEGERFASELTSSIVTLMSIAAAGIAVLLALSSP